VSRTNAAQCEWEDDAPKPSCAVAEMLPFDTIEMARERLDDGSRQDRRPIFLALASANNDLPSFEIDIFHAQLQTFLPAAGRRHRGEQRSSR
jgi:hypothetical protein